MKLKFSRNPLVIQYCGPLEVFLINLTIYIHRLPLIYVTADIHFSRMIFNTNFLDVSIKSVSMMQDFNIHVIDVSTFYITSLWKDLHPGYMDAGWF